MSPPPGGSSARSPASASFPIARRRALVSRSVDWWVPVRQRKSNLPRPPPANTDPLASAPSRSQRRFSLTPLQSFPYVMNGEPRRHADGKRRSAGEADGAPDPVRRRLTPFRDLLV